MGEERGHDGLTDAERSAEFQAIWDGRQRARAQARLDALRELQSDVYDLAFSKGWHERPLSIDGVVNVDAVAAKLMLTVSEIAEALEELRNAPGYLGEYRNEGSEKPEGFVVEMADAVIRIMDLCGALGLDLSGAIATKHAFNATRTRRHGGKAL